jgi:hypothetical protein
VWEARKMVMREWDSDGWAMNSVAKKVDGGSVGYHRWVSIEKEEPI